MAFEDLNPLAALWLKAGLGQVLLNEELANAQKTRSFAGAPNSASRGIAPGIGSQAVAQAVEAPVAQGPVSHVSAPGGAAKSPRPAAPVSPRGAEWQPVAREKFPPAWKEQLARTKTGFAAWCYHDLALDLGPEPEDEIAIQGRRHRRKFLQDVIARLKCPAGTHTFWPCGVMENGELRPDSEIFWSGLYHLGCRALFVFGRDAYKMCQIPENDPVVYRGCVICPMDHIDRILSRQGGIESTVKMMKAVLKTPG